MRLAALMIGLPLLGSCSALGDTMDVVNQMQVELVKAIDMSKRAYDATRNSSVGAQETYRRLSAAETQLGVVLNKTEQLGFALKSDASRVSNTIDGVTKAAAGILGYGALGDATGVAGLMSLALHFWRDRRKKKGNDPLTRQDMERRLAQQTGVGLPPNSG